jgi:KTSC domain
MSVRRAIDLVPVKSTSLAAIGYDPPTRTLRVNFRHGGLYDYYEVARAVYEGLLASQPHPWSSWGGHIKRSYRYQRVA